MIYNLNAKPKLIRKINRRMIIDIIRRYSPCSQTFISKETGISKQTVNKIITKLIGSDLIKEYGYGRSSEEGGKKPVLLKFNDKGKYVIGLMITFNELLIGVLDLGAGIIMEEKYNIDTEDTYEKMLSDIVEHIKSIIKKAKIGSNKILGIGFGIPGIIDAGKGIVKLAAHLPEWKEVPIVKDIEEKTGYKVFIENENRMRIYGEKWFGLATKSNDFAVLLTGEGLGCALYVNGRILSGNNLLAGEIGHLSLDDSTGCDCGNIGCLESLIYSKNIQKFVLDDLDKSDYRNSLLGKKLKTKNYELTARSLAKYYSKKDRLAEAMVDRIAYWIGRAAAVIISVIDPEIIIIHGTYSLFGEDFKNKIKEIADKCVFPLPLKKIDIKYSKLGDRAGLIGCAGIVMDELL